MLTPERSGAELEKRDALRPSHFFVSPMIWMSSSLVLVPRGRYEVYGILVQTGYS